MPLSEHEERILAEIERQLAREDPRFVARTRRSSSEGSRTRRIRWSVVGFVVGLLLLLGITFHIAFGFAGFALMLVSVVVGLSAVTGNDADAPALDRLRRLFRRHDRIG